MTKLLLAACIILLSNPAFAAADKVTIGIGDIEYRAQDSTTNKRIAAHTGNQAREDTRAFVDMLTTAFVKTRKFNIIERDRMGEILKESGLASFGVIEGGEDFNGLAGVDYLLLGAITEYGISASGLKLRGFGGTSKKATMAVDLRILDAANGTIVIADTVSVTESASQGISVKGFGSAQGDNESAVLGNLMRSTAREISILVVSTLYPVKLISVTAEQAIVNYGSGFLTEGEILDVFSQGEEMIDPDTGENLGGEEQYIGQLEIYSVQAKFSKAHIIDQQGTMERGMIARIAEKKKKQKKSRKRL